MQARLTSVALASMALMVAVPAGAQVENIRLSPDITLTLGGVLIADEGLAADNLAGNVTPVAIGAVPANADLSLYHMLENGDSLLAFDVTVTLPGAVVAQPRDIVRYNGASYSLEFDGSAEGVPAGARIDALSENVDGDLLMSFDTTVALPGVTAADEDIVAFDGATFSLLFDGSAAGLATGVDLDALHFATDSGHLFLSFDTGGMIGGTTFADEDVLEHDPNGGSWSLAYDGSAQHAAWIPGDLDAAFLAFLVGVIFSDGFENL